MFPRLRRQLSTLSSSPSRPSFRPWLERLEDRTLPASAVPYHNAILADNPAGYWRLGESSGATTAVDLSSNANNGTYTGPVALGTAGAPIPTDASTAAGFNGSTTYVNMGNPAALRFNSTTMAMEFWVNPSAYVGGEIIINKESCYEVSIGGTGPGNTITWAIQSVGNGGGWAWVDTGIVVPLNQWTNVVLVYNSGTVSAYKNGVFVSNTSQGGGAILNNGNNFEIGARSGAGSVFNGQIQDVAVYGTALSATQVLTHWYATGDGGVFFGPATTSALTGATRPLALATGDFNGDGNADFLTANYNSNGPGSVSVFLGNGAGGFTQSLLAMPAGSTGDYSVVTGDFNGDGKLDFAAASYSSNTINVFLGNGSGGFSLATGSPFSVPGFSNGIGLGVGDFNGDGKLDLAQADYGGAKLGIMLGKGDGSFMAAPGSPVAVGGNNPYYIAVGDFNNDGKLDVATANYSSNTVSVFLGNGAGGMAAAPGSPFNDGGSNPLTPVAGDFNGDGKLDLAIANNGSGNLSVFLGNGDGSFAAAGGSPIALGGNNAYSPAVGDFNGDGKLDLAVASYNGGAGYTTILQGKGNGTFVNDGTYTTANGPVAVAVSDISGDSAPDLVVANYTSNSVSVLLNEEGSKITLAGSPNPSTLGQPVSLTAHVTSTVGTAPPQVFSGSVSFFDGATLLGTAPVNATGFAVFSTSALTVGAHSLTARYADSNNFFRPSTSPVFAETISQATSSTTLMSLSNPVSAHQPATFTATVTGNGPVPATGSVTFLVNGVALATVPLSNGTASFSLTRQTATSYQVTAVYSGDSNYLTSTSAPLTQVVTFPPPTGLIAAGAGAGGVGVVNAFDAATHALRFSVIPFGIAFTGGVRVAVGDVNGDGVPDVMAAAGPGGGPLVNVYDGTNGDLIRSFFAFGVAASGGTGTAALGSGALGAFGFTGGLNVAAGDVNGDGYADIIVGADAGGGPQVEVFDGRTGAVLANFMAFGAPGFTGGVRVAAGDVNGDGKADIIVGAGIGGGPQFQVIDGATLTVIFNHYAFGTPFFTGGIYVGAGDVNGDGLADIIIGAGKGGGPQVQFYDGATFKLQGNFYAMPAGFTGGVRVAALDFSGIGVGREDIVAGAGAGGGPQMAVFDALTLKAVSDFYAFPASFRGGIFVGG